jgi:hypothetical protein
MFSHVVYSSYMYARVNEQGVGTGLSNGAEEDVVVRAVTVITTTTKREFSRHQGAQAV